MTEKQNETKGKNTPKKTVKKTDEKKKSIEKKTEDLTRDPETVEASETEKVLQCSWSLELKRDKIEGRIQETLNEYAAHVKLPGFRKGKVPYDVVKSRFYENAEDEFVNKLLEEEILNHIRKENLNIIDTPFIEDISRPKGGDVTAKVTVELAPEVSIPDLESLECTVEKKGPGYEEFDEAKEMDKVLEANKRRLPVADREIRDGDYVVLKFQSQNLENKRMNSKKESYFEMQQSGTHEINELYPELLGKKSGDQFSFVREYPADYPRHAWQGKRFEHFVEVTQHFEMQKPVLDEEFATKNGYKDLADLKEKLKIEYDKYQEKMREDKKIDAIIKCLVKASEFVIPQNLVTKEFSKMVQNPGRYISDIGQYGEDNEALFNRLKQEAEDSVRFSFLVEKVIKDNALSVNQDDLDEEYQKIADANGADVKQVKRYYQEKQQREQLKDILLKRKVIDFLKEKINVKEV